MGRVDLIRESGYPAVAEKITEESIYEILLENPEAVDDWLQHSDDKNWEGWNCFPVNSKFLFFFEHVEYRVEHTGPDIQRPSRLDFKDRTRACAVYIYHTVKDLYENSLADLNVRMRDIIEKLINIPADWHRLQVGLGDLLSESGYPVVAGKIIEESIFDVLRDHPRAVDDWYQYSDDMRWNGWCCTETDSDSEPVQYRVAYIDSEDGLRDRVFFRDRTKACATYVFRTAKDLYDSSREDPIKPWKIKSLERFGNKLIERYQKIAEQLEVAHDGLNCEVANASGGSFPLMVVLSVQRSNLGGRVSLRVHLMAYAAEWFLVTYIGCSGKDNIGELPDVDLPDRTDDVVFQTALDEWLTEYDSFLERHMEKISEAISNLN